MNKYMSGIDFEHANRPCPVCGNQMDELSCHETNSRSGGEELVLWCPVCGTAANWYDTYDVCYDDFNVPDLAVDKFDDKAKEVKEKSEGKS